MILVIDNYDSFTWNLVQRLGEIDPTLEPGRDLVVHRNDKITPEEVDALDNAKGPSHVIVSPGPCTPAQAGRSPDIIAHLAGRVAILGVCLGHQCMAEHFGMAVAQHPVLMHGKTSNINHDGRGVFAGLPNPFAATRYHSLVVVASSVPPPPEPGTDGWEVSARCTEGPSTAYQGLDVVMGLRRVWADPTKEPLEGVQFHPESFLTTEGPRLLANFLAMGSRPRSVRRPTPSGEASPSR